MLEVSLAESDGLILRDAIYFRTVIIVTLHFRFTVIRAAARLIGCAGTGGRAVGQGYVGVGYLPTRPGTAKPVRNLECASLESQTSESQSR
jgi:hypothetical protein